LIAAQPGLVSDIAYRLSRSTIIRRKRESLSPGERNLSARIAAYVGEITSPEFTELSQARRAFLLDLASGFLRYRIETTDSPPQELKDRNRGVLTAGSQVRMPSEPFPVAPFAQQPELGHKTSRASLGAGWRNNDTFEEFTVRAGYHDLLDPEIGYTPDAQIELASISLRHYNRIDQTRIERATLANIVSLSPMDSLFHSPSWKINLGMNTIHFGNCQLCSNGVVNGGIGAAVESHWLKREVLFAFAEAEANYSHAYEKDYRIGGGGTVGMLTDLTDRWKLMATGSYLGYPIGDK